MQFPNFINPVAQHEFEKLPTNHIPSPAHKPGYIYVKKYIICDSHDRIPELESPYNYTIYNFSEDRASFDDKIENIVHIKCVTAIIPRFSNVYPYLILTVQENGTIHSGLYASNNVTRKCFGILKPTGTVVNDEAFIQCTVSSSKTYNPPLQSLTSMTITMTTPSILSFDSAAQTDALGNSILDEFGDEIPTGYRKYEGRICPSEDMADYGLEEIDGEKLETLLVFEIICQVLDSSSLLHHTYIN
jgi:hypothetical protein